METLTLNEIASAVGGILSREEIGEETVSSICIDSRKLESGCLFLAIKGENFDGHDFAQRAIDSGARAVLCHRQIDCDRTILVQDTRKALLALASYYRDKFHIPVVGLTGSVGKTTTKEMIHAVLSSEKKTLKTIGNLNNEIGLPMTVFGLDRTYQAAVLEMGMSGFGEIEVLSNTAKPTAAVITNIGVSHMEKLGSQENIMKAKLEILSGMTENAPLLLNGDDGLLATVKLEGRKVYYFGMSSKCHFRAENISFSSTDTIFDIKYDGKQQGIRLPAVGIHNVMNATAAFGVGILLGIHPQKAADALEHYEACGMRQRIVRHDGVMVIEDCYNASPDSMRAALTTLRDANANVKVAVLGDMLELGEASQQFHCEVGEFAAKCADIMLCCGEKAKYYLEGFRKAGNQNCLHYSDREQLVEKLDEILEKGDAVLFKASRGMKLEEIINSLYARWNER